MRDASERVAVVTGAAQGIGRAIALCLAKEGYNVVVADFDGSGAKRLASEIKGLGRRAVAVQADVTVAEDRRQILMISLEALGRIDALVNSAGILHIRDPLQITEEEWDRVQAVNVKGTYFTCQAILPHMLERGSGRIVNIASMAAKAGSFACIPYNVSKAGIVALTRNLAGAYGRRGVNINCVCPGIVQTAMQETMNREAPELLGLAPGEFTQKRLDGIALGRVATPEDVAGVVSFLCSEDARYMTGQAVNVTGGMIFH